MYTYKQIWHLHTCRYIYIYVYIYMSMVFTYAYIHVYVYVHIYVYIFMLGCSEDHAEMLRTFIAKGVCTCICKDIYIYLYM